MKIIMIITMTMMLSGCASMPELFKTVDDIATDDCVTIKVDRDAFKKDTDVHIVLDVVNKDAPKSATP